jgi:hypothetical protein
MQPKYDMEANWAIWFLRLEIHDVSEGCSVALFSARNTHYSETFS